MRRVVLKMSVSVDGFVCGPNGEIDWIFKSADEHVTAWTVETLSQAGVHIMGSRTYYDMAAYWPSSTELIAAPMNDIPKVVFTKKKHLETASPDLTTRAFKDASRAAAGRTAPLAPPRTEESWADSRIASGDLAEEIALLKKEPGKDILAHGGASFAQSLARLGLIDEYRLLIHPVALGRGLPLFSTLSKPLHLRLLSTRNFSAGAIAHVYQPE